jgi:hypothetical protein
MGEPTYEPHDVRWTPEKVDRLWSFYASSPAHRAQFFSAHSGHAMVERFDREIGLRGKRVLDFGCGRGDLVALLLEGDARVSGLEFSAGAAEETARRFDDDARFEGVELTDALPSSLPGAAYARSCSWRCSSISSSTSSSRRSARSAGSPPPVHVWSSRRRMPRISAQRRRAAPTAAGRSTAGSTSGR